MQADWRAWREDSRSEDKSTDVMFTEDKNEEEVTKVW